MEILVSVVAKTAEYTVAPIARQVGYLLFYKENFKELKEQVEKLEGARDSIQHLVEAERRNGKEIEAVVQNWLHSVDEITKEAKQLWEDPRHGKAGCSKWSFPDLKSRHQLSRKAKKMVEVVADVQGKGNFNRDMVAYLPALQVVPSSDTRSTQNFESRLSVVKEIIRALTDSKLSKVGVYGFGGVGKTTLVKEVAAKAKDDKLFDVVVMSFVTQSPDIRSIQAEIADQLGMQFHEESLFGRACRLRERIKREKSVLIIMDNFWERLDLEEVGIPVGDAQEDLKGEIYPYMGCKVLMTSRYQNVLRKMGTQEDFRLEVLSEEETWSLFKVMAGVVNDTSIQHIATEVAKRCAGLPVLIVTVASALRNTDIHSWKDALNQLQSIDKNEMNEITYKALQLSYNRLDSEELKALFLLCAVLEGGCLISDLLKYGIGLGIFKHINTVEDSRNRLHRMISTLKSSCLLLGDDTIKNAKMHDNIRDVAISIASRDQYVFMVRTGAELKDWPSKDMLKWCPQIILSWCHIHNLPERLECPKLKLLCLNSGYNRSLQIPDSFFEGMGNLKVLDVSNMDMSSLPTSFHSLTSLKTLCLDHCNLVDIAAIGALKDLEILSMVKSSIAQFPSEIRLLTHLRMLDLTGSGIELIPPNIISNLTRLEELYMGNTSIKWELENSADPHKNASLAELRQLPNLTALDIQIRDAWILPRDLMFENLERYKVVIGDVWEWSGKYNTSKTLKLKLKTSIHLEHGIKCLIRKVEDLYLDEMNGVSNVLYQLNGKGFPDLKHLYIQNNAEIKCIINSAEWNQSQGSFPKLETLALQNLYNLKKLCHGPLMVNSFSKLSVIKVKSCDSLKYLFTFSMAKGLSQLLEIEVSQCNAMKMIVLVESDRNVDRDVIDFYKLRSLTLQSLPALDYFCSDELESSITHNTMPLFSQKVVFPNLEILKLSSINLKKIWDDNQVTTTNNIQNLTNLIVKDCGDLKYLFSSSMVASLSKLKWLEISKCHIMEEIITTEEGRNNNAFLDVWLPKLEKIIINDMQNLKTIWHPQLTASSFGELKALEVKSCLKLVNIFPSYMQRKFSNLETLTVSDCDSLEEIFQLDANETCNEEDTTQLKSMTLLRLPKLKHIWSREPQGIVGFHNLQTIRVEKIHNLEYLFPFSVAANLPQLEELFINNDSGMKYIVAEKEGLSEGTPIFVLDGLISLTLWNLNRLKGFYVGIHTLACLSLKAISVLNCKNLKLFKTLSTRQRRFADDTVYEQPLFTVEEVIPNLEELTLNYKDASMILRGQFSRQLFRKLKLLNMSRFENEEATSPYWFLQNIPTLETLVVQWSSSKEIFLEQKLGDEKEQVKISTRLKKLWLSVLPKLQHICKEGSQIDPVLEVVEILRVSNCSSLKTFLPSTAIFSHLTYLEVTSCNGLINLFTSSVVRSLVKLTTMKIKECNSVEEIVTEKEDEAEEHIIFGALKILELVCLPKLNRFCSSKCLLRFQQLETVVVGQCPRMNTFSNGSTSAVKLRKVQREESDDEWYWEGNLNRTIRKMFTEKVLFHTNHLELSESSELKEVWLNYPLPDNSFCNLKSLAVENCGFLRSVIANNVVRLLHNLEELKVQNCDAIEVVFDLDEESSRNTHSSMAYGLKRLYLSHLPKLKHVWNKDPPGSLSFQKLCVVSVVKCQTLKNVFPLSIARELIELEELEVISCGVEEAIAKQDGVEEVIQFKFPQVTSLKFWWLSNIKNLYPGRHTSEWPSLKKADIHFCDKLKIFAPDLPISQETQEEDGLDVVHQQHLFLLEKVAFPNLETLKLSSINLKKIWSDNQVTGINNIQNLTNLIVKDCGNLKYLFSSSMVATLSKLKWLEISKCHIMEEIIATEEGGNNNAFLDVQLPKLERIIISDMQNLKTIWHPQLTASSFGELKTLEVKSCPKLVNIFPSYMERKFSTLETLMVSDCDSLEEIFQLQANEMCSGEDTTQLKSMTLLGLLKLKQIWSREPQGIVRFHNLKAIRVEESHYLEYLFPFSVATNLPQLEELFLNNDSGMKYIVAENEGPTEGTPIFVLDGLTSLTLCNLYKLKGFYAGIHALAVPSLKAIDVFNCDKLELFKALSTSQNIVPDDTEYKLPLLTVEKVIPDLEELTLNNEDTNMILQSQFSGHLFSKLKFLRVSQFDNEEATFPYWFLQDILTLESLAVDYSSFKEIFRDEKLGGEEGQVKISTRLKQLTLSRLPELQHIFKEGSQIDPVLEVLERLRVLDCSSLMNLLPSSVTFGHLTDLGIKNCNGLMNIMTFSTARSLVKLRTMKINECNSIEEIVIGDKDEANDQIAFNALQILDLVYLPKLKWFCSSKSLLSFPRLEKVVVRQCPRMKTFSKGSTSTPKLRKVQVEEKDDGWCWEGDLNGTLKKMFTEKVAFRGFKHLALSEYPELKELVYGSYGQGGHQIFSNLKSLVVQKCDFSSNVLFSSNLLQFVNNLEELEVRDCASLEALIDVKGTNDKEMQMKETSQLKRLKLSGLPNLEHIWNKDPNGMISFRNLLVVHAVNCESLKNLFPVSLSKDLVQLQELTIESCGLVEIVSKDERLEECRFEFPQLTTMKLWSLTKLKSFYPGRHTLDCPSLKNLTVYHCGELQTFSFNHSDLNFQQANGVCEVDIPEVLFPFNKVSPKLELLALNSEDVMTIRNGNYQESLFHKIEDLCLQCFHETHADFPIDFLQRFPDLVVLMVHCSSFETLFPLEGIGHHNTGVAPVQIRQLGLHKLEQLKYIWGKDSQSIELVQILDSLPSSISFKNLTILEVKDCKRLMYLIKSSIAKSLLQLTRIVINNCEMIEDVVKTEEEVAEESITFKNLEYLELTSLSSLRSFCSGKQTFIWPSLVQLVVIGCPEMKTFSSGVVIAPMLQSVTVQNEKKHWKGDLNTTIQQLFKGKAVLDSIES